MLESEHWGGVLGSLLRAVGFAVCVLCVCGCVSVRSMEPAETLGAQHVDVSASASVGAGAQLTNASGALAHADLEGTLRYGIADWLDARLNLSPISGLGFGLKAQLTTPSLKRVVFSVSPDAAVNFGDPAIYLVRARGLLGINAGPVQFVFTPQVMSGRTTVFNGILSSSLSSAEYFYGTGASVGLYIRALSRLRLMVEFTAIERFPVTPGHAPVPFFELGLGYATGAFGRDIPFVPPKEAPPPLQNPPPESPPPENPPAMTL